MGAACGWSSLTRMFQPNSLAQMLLPQSCLSSGGLSPNAKPQCLDWGCSSDLPLARA